MKVKCTQSCPTLCSPMHYTVHGILQARILEWVAIPFSRRSSQPRDQTQVSHIAGRFFTSWATREALSLLQQIFPTQKLNWGLLHCRWILYQLSHQRSPRTLEWVAYPFCSRSSQFNSQKLNQGLLHCRQILYQLSYQGSPETKPWKPWKLVVKKLFGSCSLPEVPGLWLLILPNHFSTPLPFFFFYALKSFLRLLVSHGLTAKEWQAME